MPQLTDSLPKYRKHRGTGQAVVTLSSRDHYLGKHGTAASRREYDRLIGEWLASGRQSLLASHSELTIAELLSRYLGYAKTYYRKNGKPTSELAGIKSAMRILKWHYARTPAMEFGPLCLKAVRERMIEAGCREATGRVSGHSSMDGRGMPCLPTRRTTAARCGPNGHQRIPQRLGYFRRVST